MLQGERRHAVRKRHAAVRAVDRRVAQRHREGERNLLVRRQIGHNRLRDFQVAGLMDVRHDDDTHTLNHFDTCRGFGSHRGGPVIVPGDREGDRIGDRLIVCRRRRLL